jgi:hypothetical protein
MCFLPPMHAPLCMLASPQLRPFPGPNNAHAANPASDRPIQLIQPVSLAPAIPFRLPSGVWYYEAVWECTGVRASSD